MLERIIDDDGIVNHGPVTRTSSAGHWLMGANNTGTRSECAYNYPMDKMEKTELRIVAGTLRGRKITAFVHEDMRPTPQMVREALFSILGNAIPDRIFYDVFAGTGIVGIESVSRGASAARLIERDAKQVAEIQKQIDRFEIGDRCQVLRADAYRWAERWIPVFGSPINLFLSPPFPDLDAAKAAEFLAFTMSLFAKMPDESVLILQAEDGFPLKTLPEPELWDTRKYGRNLLMFRVKGDVVETVSAES